MNSTDIFLAGVVLLIAVGIAVVWTLPKPEISNDWSIPTVQNIKGCEYIRSAVNGGFVYVHKANCTNQFHKTVTN